MTRSIHQTIIPALLCAALALTACKNEVKTDSPKLDAGAATTATGDMAKAPAALEGDAAIFAALGCPTEHITATGCKVCPMFDSPQMGGDAAIKLEPGEIKATIKRAKYSESKQPQALVSYADCSPVSYGEKTPSQKLAYLEQEEGSGKWTPKLSTNVGAESEGKTCIELAHKAKALTYLLCNVSGGSGKLAYQKFELLNWNNPQMAVGGRLPLPAATKLFVSRDVDDCSNNYKFTATPKHELKDTNADGELDVVMHVELEEGPWTGDRAKSSCPGDEPLSPAREAAKKSYDLVFEAQPDGTYKETSGHPIDITDRATYSKLF